MAIKFQLFDLIKDKEKAEGRRVTYRDIKDATGINLNSITAMVNNTQRQVALDTLDRLTDFFNCDISDLLVKVDDNG